MNRLLLIAAFCAVGVSLFKIEDIGEVCRLTGSSQQFKRYFGLVVVDREIKRSWIEEILLEAGDPIPNYDWVRTMGDTKTATSFSRLHDRAPIVYPIHSYPLEFLRDEYDDFELLEFARAIVSGFESRQKTTVDMVLHMEHRELNQLP